MKPLTTRQEEILRFICNLIDEKGRPPTLQEIADEFGMATRTGPRDHLTALRKKGYLLENKHNRIEITLDIRVEYTLHKDLVAKKEK